MSKFLQISVNGSIEHINVDKIVKITYLGPLFSKEKRVDITLQDGNTMSILVDDENYPNYANICDLLNIR